MMNALQEPDAQTALNNITALQVKISTYMHGVIREGSWPHNLYSESACQRAREETNRLFEGLSYEWSEQVPEKALLENTPEQRQQ